ncbi:TlpA disulfide reductase family protein [Zoogloea sp.]|uniref:TlpA family protein disulfide reductase n=1 Tax=Zoogloea sp. TaxID=49181 RepID=UPI00260AAEE3|nr:TlpA disulfide reductase family protein [Zoogloea sp.]MDD3352204.1 TlpA disulfide reductase family protein [Zoogloea sp.]
MKTRLNTLFLILIAVATTIAGIYAARKETQSLTAPDITAAQQDAVAQLMALDLPDSAGKQHPLHQWQGKVMVVNFWATWCPPCRKEMPAFSQLSEKYAHKGIQFVGISIDTATNVRDFQAANPVAYPLVVAAPSVVSLTEVLGNTSQGLPFTVIIDRQGKLSLVKLGMLAEEDLERKLAELSQS